MEVRMTIRRVSVFGLAAVLLIASCATKPPVPTPEPEPAPEPQITAPEPAKDPAIARDELEALHGRVVALRKEAFDLGLKDLMAKEYAEAEGRYVPGKAALDADDRPKAKAELGAAEPLFKELVAKGGAMVAQTRKADAGSARERALKAGAQSLSPDSLAVAEAALAAADAALAAGDVKAAIAAYGAAITAYDAVEKRSLAVSAKARVDDLDYGPLDAGNYELAGKKLSSVDELIAKDPKAAQDASEEALLRYKLVLAKGWELSAGARRGAAERFKLDAEAIKAQVAMKAEYAEAKAVWDEAVAEFAAGDHETATATFGQAERLFEAVYDQAAVKRAAAEAAIKAAGEKAAESAGIAERGDETLSAQTGKE
jgi:hypothetical protein